MRTIFQRHYSQKIDLDVYKKGTISTVLVPQDLIKEMYKSFPIRQGKTKKLLDIRAGLRLLLNRYRGFFSMGALPFTQKPKLTFQEEGLNLVEFKFRPNDADWFELGIIAYGLGVSRCWLFSFMLGLERSGFEGFLRIPGLASVIATPSVSRPRGIFQIWGRRRYLERILHFRL